jgi:hypothetical protein
MDARGSDRAGGCLGTYVEAAIIAGLLAFNAALAYFQEGRAQATLAALKSRLALNASVRRDNGWVTVPAACRYCEAITRRRGRHGRASDRRRDPARPVHAHRRINTHRSWARSTNVRRGARASRRSRCSRQSDGRLVKDGRHGSLRINQWSGEIRPASRRSHWRFAHHFAFLIFCLEGESEAKISLYKVVV